MGDPNHRFVRKDGAAEHLEEENPRHAAARKKEITAEENEEKNMYNSRSSHIPFVPFHGEVSKFLGWKLQMEAVLDMEDLLETVTTPPASAALRSRIIGSQHDANEVGDNRSVSSSSPSSISRSYKEKRACLIITLSLKAEQLQGLILDVPKAN